MRDDDNNMDELFREAAKSYPLIKPMDSWHEVASLLNNDAHDKPVVRNKKSINRSSFLMLLVVTPLIFSALATNDGINKLSSIHYPAKKNVKQTGDKKIANMTPSGITAILQVKDAQKTLPGNTADNIQGHHKLVTDPGYSGLKSKGIIEHQVFTQGVPGNITAMAAIAADEKSSQEKREKGNVRDEDIIVNPLDSARALSKALRSDSAGIAQSASKKNISSGKQNVFTRQHSGIYLGLLAGPSFNQVKNQGLSRDGYDIGVLAGYQLNNRIAVETGLLFEKKYYFTDGKYFDMTKAGSGMPAGMKVISLEGSCAIFEVPIKLKYDFTTSHKTRFFATTGISTYIVTNEYNKYRALISGARQDVTGKYNNTSNYFAAAVNLSGGYQRKMGKLMELRIEPYLQIPVRGIGVGSLSVLSTGIHLGVTIPVIR